MKTIIILISALLVSSSLLFSQRPKEIKNSEVEGIFVTYSDFKANKLTRPTDKQHKGDKIKLKQFFISPDIISIEQDKEMSFYKDSIFAIQLSNGENYRFINRTPCLVADTSYLIIYTFKTVRTEYKQSGPHRRSKEVPITCYYFSIPNKQGLYMLTLDNLRKYALTSPDIHFAVCNKFTTNEMLQMVNFQTKRFEVNETMLSVLNNH